MDLASVKSFPDLPIDVARYLLEGAAYEDPRTAKHLTHVSKIVRQWIDPVLHHTIVIKSRLKLEKFHHSIVSRNDPMFFARHVEILLVGDYEEGCLELPPDSACPLASEKESLNVVLSACRGLERLALWLPERNSTLLPEFLGSQGCIRPTHRSVFDITATVPRLDCWPLSLTHLNLDEADIDANASIPWREIFTGCPRLTHLCLSGAAISHLLSLGRLLAWIKEPLARLSSTFETLVILLNADCLSLARNEHGIMRLRSMMDPLIQASDRLVVITRAMDDSYKVVDGVHRFPQDHSVESDWGDGRSVMDTWEFADLCIAERKRERLERGVV